MPTAAESLASIPLFANLSTRQLRKVAKRSYEHRYDAGDVMVREGGRTQNLFVILEGIAKVIKNDRTTFRRRRVRRDLDDRPSPAAATVTAETAMVCLVLEHEMCGAW